MKTNEIPYAHVPARTIFRIGDQYFVKSFSQPDLSPLCQEVTEQSGVWVANGKYHRHNPEVVVTLIARVANVRQPDPLKAARQ